MRTRAERRKNNINHIKKKKNLVHSFMGSDWYKHDGQYSKGKIHCSCPLCTGKKKGRRRNNDRPYSDRKKIDSMAQKAYINYFDDYYDSVDENDSTVSISGEDVIDKDVNAI